MNDPDADGVSFTKVQNYVRETAKPAGAGSQSKSDVVGGMSLAQLREQLATAAMDPAVSAGTDSLLELVKQKREREKLEELRQVKIKHQQLRARKRQESTEISKVMMELEKRKQQELELRLQKERIQQGLERVDRTHLGQMEAKKRKELEALTKERQALQDKEEAILHQVEELEQKIIEQEELNAKRKQEVEDALVRRKGSRLEHKNAELLRLAANYGQRTSTLLVERNKLEQERQRLQDQLQELSGGQSTHSAAEAEELDAFVDAVQSRISEQQERVALMKLKYEQAQKDWTVSRIADDSETKMLRPPGLGNSLPFTVEAESFLTEWLEEDPNRKPALQEARSMLDEANAEQHNSLLKQKAAGSRRRGGDGVFGSDENDAHGAGVHFAPNEDEEPSDSPARRQRESRKHRDHSSGKHASASPHKRGGPASLDKLSPESRRLLEEELDLLKQEYANMGVDSPSLWGEIQALEKQLGYRPSRRPPTRLQVPTQQAAAGAPWLGPGAYPSPTSQGAPVASPLVELQFEKQQRILDRQAKTLRKIELNQEKAKIRAEMEKHARSRGRSHAGGHRKSRSRRGHPRSPSTGSMSDSSDSSSTSSPSSSSASSSSASYYRGPRARRSRRHRRERGRRHREPAPGYTLQSQQITAPEEPPADVKQLEQQQRVFTRTMESLTRKLQALGAGDPLAASLNRQHAASAQGGQDLASLAQGDVDKNKFAEELSTLDMIPRDSELYDIQVEHLKMMTRMRLEIEELKQQQRISDVKEDLERKQRELAKKSAFEELKVDQERQLELAKLRKALARESLDMNWNGRGGPQIRPYDAQAGFACYFDYVSGIPKRFPMVRLVYCVYEDATVRSGVKSLPGCETELDTPTRGTAVFVTRKKFTRIPPVASLRVIMELQCVVDGPEGRAFQSIGWTALDIFRLGPHRDDPLGLNDGPHQIKLRRPPFKVSEINNVVQPGADADEAATGAEPMMLFLRLVHMEDLEIAKAFVVDPCVTQHLYKPWPPRKESKKSPSTRRKDKASTRRKAKGGKGTSKTVDDVSEIASVADKSVLSGESMGGRSMATSVRPKKASKQLKKLRVNFHLDHVAFARENPAHMVFVRVVVLPNKACVESASRNENLSLASFPQTSAVIDFASLPGRARVWESEARDIRVSTGQASWTRAQTNPTFFDGLGMDPDGVILVKVFERLPEGLSARPDQESEHDDDDGDDDNDGAADFSRKALDGSSAKLVGWAARSLLNPDGVLESGGAPITLDLLQPPVTLPADEDRAEFLDARIVFSLAKVPGSGGSVVSTSSSVGSRRPRARRQRRASRSISSIVEEDEDDMRSSGDEEDSEAEGDEGGGPVRDDHDRSDARSDAAHNDDHAGPFVENNVKLARHPALFERGEDGFDVYVDGARCLPDYTTITAVHVKLLAPNLELIGEEHRAYPRLSDSSYNPKFGLRAEFRGEAIANPASTLLFRVDTVDRFTKATKAIGYTCLNPFCLPNGTSEQASKPATQEYALLRGGFQLALHQDRPDTTQTFTARHFETSPKVPCATLLVRILPAKKSKDNVHILRLDEVPREEWEKQGLVVPAPRYGPRAKYDTTRCEPLPCEQKLYTMLADREEVLVGEMVSLARRPGVVEDKHVDVMEDDELQDWIRKRLSQPQGMMPLDHAAQYQPETGFAVSIESLVGLRSRDVGKTKLHKVIFSLNPPGAYYGEPRLTDDVAFTTTHDFGAALSAPKFLDELHAFRDVPYDPKLVLVLDVRLVRTDRMQEEMYAWAIVPLFSKHGPYIRNGRTHAPLFEGSVNVSVLADLQSADSDPESFLLAEMEKGKQARIKLTKGNSSAVVRVLDNLVKDCMRFGAVQDVGVPEKLAAKFASQLASTEAPVKKGYNLGATLPKAHREEAEAFERVVNEEFAKLTGISNYTF